MWRPTLLLLLTTSLAARAQNLADGKDVYGPCAACHGANAEGGKGGEYPRLAGMPASFLIMSLKQFQDRKRHNMPMVPYTEPRELSDRDMKDVAAYIESIKLPTRAPEPKPTDSALDRLLALEKVLVVPRVKGDVEQGQALYKKECASCHGKRGEGRESRDAPGLVGQYPNYLQRQVEAFRKGLRGAEEDDPMNDRFEEITDAQVTDILAWLTANQDLDAAPTDGASAPDAGVK